MVNIPPTKAPVPKTATPLETGLATLPIASAELRIWSSVMPPTAFAAAPKRPFLSANLEAKSRAPKAASRVAGPAIASDFSPRPDKASPVFFIPLTA